MGCSGCTAPVPHQEPNGGKEAQNGQTQLLIRKRETQSDRCKRTQAKSIQQRARVQQHTNARASRKGRKKNGGPAAIPRGHTSSQETKLGLVSPKRKLFSHPAGVHHALQKRWTPEKGQENRRMLHSPPPSACLHHPHSLRRKTLTTLRRKRAATHRLHGVHFRVGGSPLDHLDRRDPETPYIRFRVISVWIVCFVRAAHAGKRKSLYE